MSAKRRRKAACTCDVCRNAKKDAAIAAMRALVATVDTLRGEGEEDFGGFRVRRLYAEVLHANDRAAATLAYLDGKEARRT